MLFFRKTSWFTLIELILAITIFWWMSVAILSIYIQTTSFGQRMRSARYVSESAREITERIADDVREGGIAGTVLNDGTSYSYWNNPDTYRHAGSKVLTIGDGNVKYVYGKKSRIGESFVIQHCDTSDKINPKIHCWLYRVQGNDYSHAFNLVDGFIPEEEKKRVKVQDLKFYVSGDGIFTEKKVTVVMTLVLMPRSIIPASLVQETALHIQTTISERFFQENP